MHTVEEYAEWAAELPQIHQSAALELIADILAYKAFVCWVISAMTIKGGPLDYQAKRLLPELYTEITGRDAS